MRRTIISLMATAGLLVGMTGTAQAFYVDPNVAEWDSVIEDAAVNRILTQNRGFGPNDGASWGTTVSIISAEKVQVDERRDYFNQGTFPCYRYRNVVTNVGQYVGQQTVWQVSCSTGVITSHVLDRTWYR